MACRTANWVTAAIGCALLCGSLVGCSKEKADPTPAATAADKAEVAKAAMAAKAAEEGKTATAKAPEKAGEGDKKPENPGQKPDLAAVAPTAAAPGAVIAPSGKAEVPELKLVKSAATLDWAEINKTVDRFKGKVVACSNLLAPSPLAVDAGRDKEPMALIDGEVDDRRSALFCRTKAGGVDTVPVQVYFGRGDKGHLVHIDQDTVVNIEVRGKLGNQVVGVFRGVVSAPRRQVFDSSAPDLLKAVIWPDAFKGKDIRCTSKMAVSPQKVARFDRPAVELVGGETDVQKVMARCEDAGGGGVSVLVLFPKGKGGKALELGAETVFTLTLHGYVRGNLVGMFKKLESGAVKAEAGELKQVLFDAAPHVGKKLTCTSLVAPLPREIGAIDEQETKQLRDPIDDRKTTLMCGQRSGGSVGVSLYFKKGQKAQILRMAANSKVVFTFWGVNHNRLFGVHDSIKSGAIETKDPNDLRAVALSAEKFAGKTVTCDINLAPFVSALSYMGDAKTALLKDEVLADRNAVLTCKDATGSLGGTRVEVYFKKVDRGAIDSLEQGAKVSLRVKGSAFNTLIAVFVKKLG